MRVGVCMHRFCWAWRGESVYMWSGCIECDCFEYEVGGMERDIFVALFLFGKIVLRHSFRLEKMIKCYTFWVSLCWFEIEFII